MKANLWNLSLLLMVGTAFIMGVVSVTNAMYTLNVTALPALPNVTTAAPTPAPPPSTTAPTTAAPMTSSTAAAVTTSTNIPDSTVTTTTVPAPTTPTTHDTFQVQAIQRERNGGDEILGIDHHAENSMSVVGVAPPSAASSSSSSSYQTKMYRHHDQLSQQPQQQLQQLHQHHRVFEVQDFPERNEYFTITCRMFLNCTRAGAGVPSDDFVGDLNTISETLGCGSANIARALCMVTLGFSVLATLPAAGAAQEISCAQRGPVRYIILVGSIFTFIFSLLSVVFISLLQTCLSEDVPNVQDLVSFFSVRPGLSDVESIAFPVYLVAMSTSAVAVIMCVLWILEIAGPPVMEPATTETTTATAGGENGTAADAAKIPNDSGTWDSNQHSAPFLLQDTEMVAVADDLLTQSERDARNKNPTKQNDFDVDDLLGGGGRNDDLPSYA